MTDTTHSEDILATAAAAKARGASQRTTPRSPQASPKRITLVIGSASGTTAKAASYSSAVRLAR